MSDELGVKYLFDQMQEQQKQFTVAIEKISAALDSNTIATNKLSEKIVNLEENFRKRVNDCKNCSITVFGRILLFLVFVVGGIAIGREIFANKDFLSVLGKIFF